ncbi:hypothetical protein DMN91_009724 [Ooceraea biroi]|uniref:Uncharacterized protein n=1 Tax=Ooceraea biroi TaxID=2015173 RepID=A0A3L8DC88_OOCBI|nr:hypothetical protein DMN91_009724 [Ooceraea biroi]
MPKGEEGVRSVKYFEYYEYTRRGSELFEDPRIKKGQVIRLGNTLTAMLESNMAFPFFMGTLGSCKIQDIENTDVKGGEREKESLEEPSVFSIEL